MIGVSPRGLIMIGDGAQYHRRKSCFGAEYPTCLAVISANACLFELRQRSSVLPGGQQYVLIRFG